MRSRHWHNLWEFNSFKLIFHAINAVSRNNMNIEKVRMNAINIEYESHFHQSKFFDFLFVCVTHTHTQLSDKNSWILIGNRHRGMRNAHTMVLSGAHTRAWLSPRFIQLSHQLKRFIHIFVTTIFFLFLSRNLTFQFASVCHPQNPT